MTMSVVRKVPELRAAVSAWRRSGERVALVPTMGALHAGHLSLVADAKRRADRVLVTIFVNPKQFGAGEDLDRYPRQEAADAEALEVADCDLLFAPPASEVYPAGHATTVTVAGLGDILCGAARPGHFDGVATVVAKLLNMAQADVAVFGEKDWQQLAIIRRMAADLDIPTEIAGSAIVRDADGLALSSRNAYLSTEQRAQAVALPRALAAARDAIVGGEDVSAALSSARAALHADGFGEVDYVELRDEATLEALDIPTPGARLFAAARIGATRLIDNLLVGPDWAR